MPSQAPAKFKLPPVKVGDAVLWAHDKNRIKDAVAAIVTGVGQEAINLIYFPPDSRGGTPRDGVRHVDDPANNRIMSDAGVFDFGHDRKRLDDFELRLKSLEATYTVTDDDGK